MASVTQEMHMKLPIVKMATRAYVTFLAGPGDYWKGVVGLAKGLRSVESVYPLVVAVHPDVPEAARLIFSNQGCIVREVEPVVPPESQIQSTEAYSKKFAKLRVFEFAEYDKMVFLEPHVLVQHNIDGLFEQPDGYLCAVMDCFCHKEPWEGSHTSQYGDCQQHHDKAAGRLAPPKLYFNGGMFVFEPNPDTAKALLGTLHITPPSPLAEEYILNKFFEEKTIMMSYKFNLVLPMIWKHPGNIDLHQVSVVNYCSPGSEPWKFTGKEENMDRADVKMLVDKWWEVYNDESLNFKDDPSVGCSEHPTEAGTVISYLRNLQVLGGEFLARLVPSAP